MTKILITSCALMFLAGDEMEYGQKTPEELVAAIEKAAEDKSKEDFLKTMCRERLPENLQKRFEATTPLFMSKELSSIKLIPEADDPFKDFEGFEYNIEYQGIIELTYEGMDQPIKMPYGKFNERYYLASMVKEGRFPDSQ